MDAVSYFDGSCGPALLELLSWLAALGGEAALETAQACLARLERLASQILPLDGEAMLAEARGEVAAMRGESDLAASHFAEAAAGWAVLARPLAQARTLVQFSRAAARLGEHERAAAASGQAAGLVEGLRSRLADPGLRQSFSDSDLMASLRESGTRRG
jgi:hypothetical protein